jgi:hypothetical protein
MSHCKHHRFCQCESCVCPDCRQRLDEPARPIAYLGRRPVWCATCEACHVVPTVPDRADLEPVEAVP